jgi:hypothetical protein
MMSFSICWCATCRTMHDGLMCLAAQSGVTTRCPSPVRPARSAEGVHANPDSPSWPAALAQVGPAQLRQVLDSLLAACSDGRRRTA